LTADKITQEEESVKLNINIFEITHSKGKNSEIKNYVTPISEQIFELWEYQKRIYRERTEVI
jgi:hypothetical protein